jgi:arylsulfatase A-like enzyme
MPKPESEYKKNNMGGYSKRTVVVVSVILGFLVGLLSEILIDLTYGPSNLQEFISMQLTFLVSATVIMVVYLILWVLFINPVGHILKLDMRRLCLSLAAFLCTSYLYYIVHDWLSFGLLPVKLGKIFFLTAGILMAVFISGFVYFVSGVILCKATYHRIATAFSLAMPFVLVEAMLGLCVNKYLIPAGPGVYSFVINIVLLLIILLTIVIFLYTKDSRPLVKAVQILVLLIYVVLVPASIFFQNQPILPKQDAVFKHNIKYVILISIDALRADALSCYGEQYNPTPHIDKLAADGVIFKNAFAPSSWTVPTVTSILTGLPLSVHMVRNVNSRLDDVFPTLAEYMWEKGYVTSAFVLNPILRKKNISQGFMWYNFFPKRGNPSIGMRLLTRLNPYQYGRYVPPKDMTGFIVDWIDSHVKDDFFLWIHYFDPHMPYEPTIETLPKREPLHSIGTSFESRKGYLIRAGQYNPSSDERKWIKELYLSEVRGVDKCVGLLLNHLKKINIYDDSLIIVTSDHGEEFWEHDGFEHGHTLYNELLSVPLMIKLPQNLVKGAINKAVSINSILPTILDLCKTEYIRERYPDVSLVPLWKENSLADESVPIISAGLGFYEDRESVIFEGQKYKYIRWLISNKEELYDLMEDPGEKVSIAHLSIDKIKRAREILSEHYQSAQKLKEHYNILTGSTTDLDKDMIQRLKSLGYLK